MSGIATAIVGSAVVGGYMSSEAQKEAAGTAADAQLESTRLATAESRRQFEALQELLSPYVKAGETSLTAQQALIGLGGPEAQANAIAAIEGSPMFAALTQQGEEGILAGGSATGQLRGGNIRGALAQFRPRILSELIESQYRKLSGITQMGQASAAGVGATGIESGRDISQLLLESGRVQAEEALAGGRAQAELWGDIAGAVGTVAGRSKGRFGRF